MKKSGSLATNNLLKLILVLGVVVFVLLSLFGLGLHNKLDLFLPNFIHDRKSVDDFDFDTPLKGFNNCPEDYPIQIGIINTEENQLGGREIRLCDLDNPLHCIFLEGNSPFMLSGSGIQLVLRGKSLFGNELYRGLHLGNVRNIEIILFGEYSDFIFGIGLLPSMKEQIFLDYIPRLNGDRYFLNLNSSFIFEDSLCREKVISREIDLTKYNPNPVAFISHNPPYKEATLGKNYILFQDNSLNNERYNMVVHYIDPVAYVDRQDSIYPWIGILGHQAGILKDNQIFSGGEYIDERVFRESGFWFWRKSKVDNLELYMNIVSRLDGLILIGDKFYEEIGDNEN